jgi:nicotinamidase-related amidase
MKPALLIIDVQNRFFETSPTTAESLTGAIQHINEAIGLFREKELPIICIQNVNPDDNLQPGEPGFDVPEAIELSASDGRIHKRYRNAFNKTSLMEKLKEHDVDTVIVTGYCAGHCVLSTYRGAEDLDLKAIMLHGAIASNEPSTIPVVESFGDVMTYGALKHALQ